MKLTTTGKTLLDYDQKINNLLHNALLAIQNSEIPQGTFTIGSVEPTAAVQLPKILVSSLTPRIMELGTLEAILGGVRAGLGVTLLPRSVIGDLEMKGLLSCYRIPKQYGDGGKTLFH